MFNYKHHVTVYRSPDEFPYDKKGMNHYILEFRLVKNGTVFTRRVFVDKLFLHPPFLSKKMKRIQIFKHHSYFVEILNYLITQLKINDEIELIDIRFGYGDYRYPINYFWWVIHYLRHRYWKVFQKNGPNDLSQRP